MVKTNGDRARNNRIDRKEANFAMYATFMSVVTAVVGSVTLFSSAVMDIAFDTGMAGTILIYVLPLAMTLYTILVMIAAHLYHKRSMLPFYLAATVWLGCFTYMFVFSVLVIIPTILLRTGLIPGSSLLESSIRVILIAGPILLVTAGVVNARYLRIRRVRIPMKGLKKEVRIGFFSDLHLGLLIGRRRLGRVIDALKRSGPDIIVIGGDLFDTEPGNIIDMLPRLSEFGEIAPAYAVNGNHEYFNDLDACDKAIREAGIRLLRNEKARDRRTGLEIFGVDDPAGYQQYGEEMADIDRVMGNHVKPASIMISHQPIDFPRISGKGAGLMLSGHTHGGQIEPFGIFTRLIFRDGDRGLRTRGDSHLFVSTGAGTWGPPMRVGTSPEIVIIDLIPG
ncbi:MAG: metallophosphoesterase [Thermoplasmatota archaeon]